MQPLGTRAAAGASADPDRAPGPRRSGRGPQLAVLRRRAHSLRLRIGGRTIRLRYDTRAPALRLPRGYEAFGAKSGADIDLEVVLAPVPVPDAAPVFESGGTWRAYEVGAKILYVFRRPMGKGPPARGLLIDRRRRRGTLYLAPGEYLAHRGFALSFPLDELLLQHHFAYDGGLVLHASGVDTGRGLVAFTGHSGAGKSTISRLFRRHAPLASVLSDDRLVIRRRRGQWWAYGTPWHGTARHAAPRALRLRALFVLKQSRTTALTRIEPQGFASQLLAFSFLPPWEPAAFFAVLRTAESFARAVPSYSLAFRKDASAVAAVGAIISGGSAPKPPSGRRSRRGGG